FLARFNEVVDSAGADFDISAVDLVDAVGDPVDDQSFDARIPERAVELVGFGVDGLKGLGGRRFLDGDSQGGGVRGLAVVGSELEDVGSGRGEFGGGDQRFGIGERYFARSGFLTPSSGYSRTCRRRGRRRGIAIPRQSVDLRRLSVTHPSAQICFA